MKGESNINLPYLFSKNLIKMIEGVKNKTKAKEAHIYHQGLIKILVEHQVRSKGSIWREFLVQHHLEGQITEEIFYQMHVTRIIMNSLMYPRTRSKKKQDSVMIEKEISFLFVPRKTRKKTQEEPSEKKKNT